MQFTDGDFDYSSLTRAQLEYAVDHIDEAEFPKNLANARAALEARVAGESPEPPPILDAATSARYTYWIEKFVAVLIAAYAAFAVAVDDLVIPSFRRARLIHLHGGPAWIGVVALVILASIPFFDGVTDTDPPTLRPRFRLVFRLALALIAVAIAVNSLGPDRLTTGWSGPER